MLHGKDSDFARALGLRQEGKASVITYAIGIALCFYNLSLASHFISS